MNKHNNKLLLYLLLIFSVFNNKIAILINKELKIEFKNFLIINLINTYQKIKTKIIII